MDAASDTRVLQRLIWLYFWLLMIEGALRKWILPSLSTPLLIVRDPVVILIYWQAFQRGLFPKNAFIKWIVALAVLDSLASWAGIGNLKVTLFGLRADFLHLPLIFVVPAVFDRDDVRKMGTAFLLVLFPMTLIALKQFRDGPDAWINVGAGGGIGGQLFASEGKVRPSGTFSFVNGMVAYLAFVTAFLMERFLRGRVPFRSLALAAIPVLVLTLAVSASRSALGGAAVVLFAALAGCLRQRRLFGKALRPVAAACLAYAILGSFRIFHEGLTVHRERFYGSGGLREGIVERFFSNLVSVFYAAGVVPFFGFGLGVGTNAGAGLLSGARQFLLAEGEWPRLVLESGVLLGFAFIFLRLVLCWHVGLAAWRALGRGEALPLLLLGACALDLASGQFGQPTILGFVCLGAGLALAAAQCAKTDDTPEPSAAPPLQKTRGRAPFAEALHRDA